MKCVILLLFLLATVDVRALNCSAPCGAGYFILTGGSVTSCTSNCTPCGPGEFSTGGTSGTNCTQCSPGTFSSGYANSACTECDAGSFASNYGSSSCTLCPLGTFSAANSATCSPCAAGTFANTTNTTTCQDCTTGRYTPTTGFASCLTCGEGFITTDHIACVACPINTSTDIANSVYTCTIDCNNFTGGQDFISSGFGGPCFDPADLNLNTTIRVSNCNNAPTWAIVTVSVLGAVIVIIFIAGAVYFASVGEIAATSATSGIASNVDLSFFGLGIGTIKKVASKVSGGRMPTKMNSKTI